MRRFLDFEWVLARAEARARTASAGVWAVACLLFGGMVARGSEAGTNDWATRLRDVVRLPQVAFNFEPNFSRAAGITAMDEVVDPNTDLARLEPEVRANPKNLELRLRGLRLALLTGDTNTSGHWRRETLSHFEAWAKAEPSNGVPLIGWGRALWLQGDDASAEPLLRRATTLQSNRWDGWVALADVLGTGCLTVFTGWGDRSPANAMGAYFSGQLKPAGNAVRARSLLAEAVACLDQAKALAPKDPLAATARLPFLLDLGMRRRVLSDPQRPEERQDAVSRRHQAEAAGDVEAALELNPDDHRLLGLSIYLRVLPEMGDAGVGWNVVPEGGRAVDSLSSATRQWLEQRLGRLEALATSHSVPGTDAAGLRRAAGAAELLATYRQTLYADLPTAQRWAGRVLEWDPSRRVSVDLIIAGYVRDQRWPALEEFCRRRLTVRDDATVRLILAKAQFYQGRKAEALATLVAADGKFPEDRLLLAAHCSARLAAGERVSEPAFVQRLARIFPDPANTPDDTDANRAVLMAALISQALDGELAAPKQILRNMLVGNPADDYARSVWDLVRSAPSNNAPR